MVVHCPAGIQSRYQSVVIMTLRSSIEEVSKRYHQNFLLCDNNEITACLEDLLNSFCEEVYCMRLHVSR